MRLLAWISGALGGLLILAVVALWIVWVRSYEDETIVEGSRWGVEIGADKAATLRGLQDELRGVDANLVIFFPPEADGGVRAAHGGPLREARLEEVLGHDRWIVAWVGEALNELTLSFEGGSLRSAHRKARAFELP